MVYHGSTSETPVNGGPPGSIDPYVLIEALTGQKLDRNKLQLPYRTACEGYDDLSDFRQEQPSMGQGPEPDQRPQNVHVGAINPYALVENMIGHKIDRHSMAAARIIADTLQTDYEELFDMKHDSVLFAGLKLNKQERQAEELSEEEMRILDEKDLVTPDLSQLEKLGDLERVGLKGFGGVRIKRAGMQNGNIHLVLHAHSLGRTVCNRDVTLTLNEFSLPFRWDRKNEKSFTPPNSSWRDANEVVVINSMRRRLISDQNTFFDYGGQGMRGSHHGDHLHHERKFDDPIQGATSNSWFIAALFSVFWSDPMCINRNTTMHGLMDRHHDDDDDRNRRLKGRQKEEDRRRPGLSIRFHDQGGRNNNNTQTVEVNYQIPVNNSSNDPVYCRSSDGFTIWPSLYEKAFTKWITGHDSDAEQVDVTQTHHGDPVKAMAQINGRSPHYYHCAKHSAAALVGLVRAVSVNHRTIVPTVAWTHATDTTAGSGSGRTYSGSNLVANHAYSVLGWSSVGQRGDRQYIIVRNPWGVTEPRGVTSYPGVLDRVEPEYWRPASLCDSDGVLAIEAEAFKEYFQYVGVAK
ncbi:hypothetical protein F5Y15DRAFT_427394 [Xylariaceae sp. FL0016]|nr:hypothetical protein F5Y15DRAFT_427394 [Xylariaceae sp. FL0016]